MDQSLPQRVDFSAFVFRSIGRAVTDGASYFGLNLRTAVTAIVLVGLGLFLYYRVKGVAAFQEQLLNTALLTGLPTIFFMAALLVWHLFRAPYLIYTAEYAKVATRVGELSEQNAQREAAARSEIEGLTKQRDEALEKLKVAEPMAAEAKGLREANIALQSANNTTKHARANRQRVAEMLAKGNRLKGLTSSLEERPHLEKEALDWNAATYRGLAEIDSSYAARFQTATGPSYSRSIGGKELPQINTNVWNFLNQRTEALARILETMAN